MLIFFQAEDGIRDGHVTGVQTCALPISLCPHPNPTKDDRASPCTGASKTGTRAIYTRRATPSRFGGRYSWSAAGLRRRRLTTDACVRLEPLNGFQGTRPGRDRKSTRLNSSHVAISYAVFCLKKK